LRLRFGFPTRASQFVPLLSGRDGRVWGSGGPWGFRCDVPAPGRSPARPSVTFGAFLRRSRTRRLSPTRDHHRFGPGTSRTSPQRGGLGSCLLNPIRPWSSCRLSRATVSLRFTVAGVAAYLGCPKIASPSVHLAGVHSQLRPLPHLRGWWFVAFEAGVATALSRDPPTFRPCRFYDFAGFLLLQATRLAPGPDPGVRCVSDRFGSRLCCLPRCAVSTLRSFAPRRTLRPSLTRWSRRFISRIVADAIH